MAGEVLIVGLMLQLFEDGFLLGLVLDKPLFVVDIGMVHDLELINADNRWSLYDLDVVRDDFRLRQALASRAVSNADTELMLLLDGVPRLLLFGKLDAN